MSTPTTVNVTTQKADAVLQLQALLHGILVKLPGVDPFLLVPPDALARRARQTDTDQARHGHRDQDVTPNDAQRGGGRARCASGV